MQLGSSQRISKSLNDITRPGCITHRKDKVTFEDEDCSERNDSSECRQQNADRDHARIQNKHKSHIPVKTKCKTECAEECPTSISLLPANKGENLQAISDGKSTSTSKTKPPLPKRPGSSQALQKERPSESLTPSPKTLPHTFTATGDKDLADQDTAEHPLRCPRSGISRGTSSFIGELSLDSFGVTSKKSRLPWRKSQGRYSPAKGQAELQRNGSLTRSHDNILQRSNSLTDVKVLGREHKQWRKSMLKKTKQNEPQSTERSVVHLMENASWREASEPRLDSGKSSCFLCSHFIVCINFIRSSTIGFNFYIDLCLHLICR